VSDCASHYGTTLTNIKTPWWWHLRSAVTCRKICIYCVHISVRVRLVWWIEFCIMRDTYNIKTMYGLVLVLFLIGQVRNRRTSLPTLAWTQQVHFSHIFDSFCIGRICLAGVNNTWRACHFVSLIWSLSLLLFTSATGWLHVWPNGHLTEVAEKLFAGLAASEALVCCICASRFVALCINNTPWWRRIGAFQGYKLSYSLGRGCLCCWLVFSWGHVRISDTLPEAY